MRLKDQSSMAGLSQTQASLADKLRAKFPKVAERYDAKASASAKPQEASENEPQRRRRLTAGNTIIGAVGGVGQKLGN
jgi:hypothetical protein